MGRGGDAAEPCGVALRPSSFEGASSGAAAAAAAADAVDAVLSERLFEAARCGDVLTVDAMIDRGLHVGPEMESARRCPRGATALHYASGNGHVGVVRLLVERGAAELNCLCSIAGGTPLMWAASQNQKDVCTLLLAYGADPGRPVVPSMFQSTWVRKTSGTPLGETALMVAAQYGHHDICRMLCERKSAIVTITNAYGQTALHIAALFGRSQAAAVLLEFGASPDVRDAMGVRAAAQAASPAQGAHVKSTPLLLCAEHGHAETALALLWRGSNVASRDWDGCTVAQVASSRGHEAVAQICHLWAAGRLCGWSPALHAFFPRAFRADVRSALLATAGSPSGARLGLRNILGALLDCGVLLGVFRELLDLHMARGRALHYAERPAAVCAALRGGAARPVGHRLSSETGSESSDGSETASSGFA